MSILTDAIERLRALVFRRREERELAEELQFHLDMEAELHRNAGLSDAGARRRGAISLGGVERVKDDVRDARGTRWIDECVKDLRFTARSLRQSPGFTTVAILTLAIGIGGTTAVFSVVDTVLLQPLPYQQPGQLVRLYQADSAHPADRGFVTPVHFLEYRSRLSSLESVAATRTYDVSGADIGRGDAVRRIRVLPVSADYFDALGVHPAMGRGFQREEETGASVVILSHALWEQQFKDDTNSIGKSITMSGQQYAVAGVMPSGFSDPVMRDIDAWVPLDLTGGKDASNADNHYLTVLARLRPGVPMERAQAELDVLGQRLAKQYPIGSYTVARLYPLKQDIVGNSTRALELMLGAVALVLLLVCVNMANLLLVRGSARARELAVRSALGAERARLVRQMLVESLTLALVGAVAGLIVARLAMSAIVQLGAASIPRLATLGLDQRLLAFSLVVASVCAVGFGLAPALRASRVEPGDVLRDQSRAATGGAAQLRLRESLVVSQVALAFVLLVGAGLLLASLARIQNIDLGVNPANVLTFEVHLPDARYDSTARDQFHQTLDRQLASLPGVVATGATSRLPATGQYHQWGVNAVTGPVAGTKRGHGEAEQRIVSGDYFKAVGIPLVEGRLFDARDLSGTPNHVVVSRSLAQRIFPGVSAVGQQLRTGGRTSEIVGVVGDVSVDGEGTPDTYVYHPHTQYSGERNWSLTQVVRSAGSLDALTGEATRTLHAIDPLLVAYRPTPLTDAIGQNEAQRRFTLRMLLTFSLVALALAALGQFGVLSYGVRLRTREFGIRMALGAERGARRRMVLRRGLMVTAIGTAVGLIAACVLSRLMTSMLFHVSPVDPVVLAGATVFMLVVSGIAVYLPARGATAIDPRTTLQ